MWAAAPGQGKLEDGGHALRPLCDADGPGPLPVHAAEVVVQVLGERRGEGVAIVGRGGGG